MSKFIIEKEWIFGGLDCVVLKTSMGYRCGYVGIPKTHRLYEIHYNNAKTIEDEYFDVHGGLTYCGIGNYKNKDGVKKLYPSQVDNDLWWFGFDCAHLGDAYEPDSEMERYNRPEDIYRSLEYCVNECEKLVFQLMEIS